MSRKEIEALLERARRSLAAAETLLREGHSDFAVSRAYYAMFYAAQALLLTRDVRRTKHSGIIAAFNESFVRSGELPHELFLLLRDAFEDRAEDLNSYLQGKNLDKVLGGLAPRVFF